MTIKELKEMLSAIIEELNDIPEDKEVNLQPNTYAHYGTFLSTYDGYIFFNELVDDEEDEEEC